MAPRGGLCLLGDLWGDDTWHCFGIYVGFTVGFIYQVPTYSLSKNIYIYIHIIHMKTTQQHLRPIWILSSITSAAASTSKLQVDGNLGAG